MVSSFIWHYFDGYLLEWNIGLFQEASWYNCNNLLSWLAGMCNCNLLYVNVGVCPFLHSHSETGWLLVKSHFTLISLQTCDFKFCCLRPVSPLLLATFTVHFWCLILHSAPRLFVASNIILMKHSIHKIILWNQPKDYLNCTGNPFTQGGSVIIASFWKYWQSVVLCVQVGGRLSVSCQSLICWYLVTCLVCHVWRRTIHRSTHLRSCTRVGCSHMYMASLRSSVDCSFRSACYSECDITDSHSSVWVQGNTSVCLSAQLTIPPWSEALEDTMETQGGPALLCQ